MRGSLVRTGGGGERFTGKDGRGVGVRGSLVRTGVGGERFTGKDGGWG